MDSTVATTASVVSIMSSMVMDVSSTASTAMATSTSTGGMSHGSDIFHESMSMGGMGSGNGCKISMLWNWNTVDACFISSSWRITSTSMFVGSCFGVIILTMSLELLRRIRHVYDTMIIAKYLEAYTPLPKATPQEVVDRKGTVRDSNSSVEALPACPTPVKDEKEQKKKRRVIRPKLWEQIIRALLNTIQFATAYFVMLLAMYYNGYFIICILIGAFLGYFILEYRLPVGVAEEEEEATGCCG